MSYLYSGYADSNRTPCRGVHNNADSLSRLKQEVNDTSDTIDLDLALPVYAITFTSKDSELLADIEEEQRNDHYWGPLVAYLEEGAVPKEELEFNRVLSLSRDYNPHKWSTPGSAMIDETKNTFRWPFQTPSRIL